MLCLLLKKVIRYQCLTCQMKAGVFFNNFFIIVINNKIFSATNKASRAQKKEIVTVCLQICLIIRVTSDQISMFDMSNGCWSLLQYFFLSFWLTTKLFSATNKASRALEAKLGITHSLKCDLRPNEWFPLFFSFVCFILWRLFISARENPSNNHGTWSKQAKTEIIRIDAAPPGGQILQILFAQKSYLEKLYQPWK